MRLRHLTFLLGTACGGVASQGAPDATTGWSQVLGVYGDCSFGNLGFASGSGGTLTLTENASGALTVTYAATQTSFSLEFTPTSDTSAVLAPTNQSMPWEALCWTGAEVTDSGVPIDPGATALTLRVTSGALTYDAETVFLSVVGTPETDATCEGKSTGSLTCSRE